MLTMKYITRLESCTNKVAESEVTWGQSHLDFSTVLQDVIGKWKWDRSFAQTLIICMINERCQDWNPTGRRTQLEVTATEIKRSISPSPACLIRGCSDLFPEQSTVVLAPPFSFFFFSFKVWNSSCIWIKHTFHTAVQQSTRQQWIRAWKRQWRNTIPLNHFSLFNVTVIAEQFNKCCNKQCWQCAVQHQKTDGGRFSEGLSTIWHTFWIYNRKLGFSEFWG